MADRLKRCFTPLVRRAFWELGLTEREIIERVSNALSAFARSDHLYRLRSLQGKSAVRAAVADAEASPPACSAVNWQRLAISDG